MGYVTKKAAQRFEEKKAAIYVRVSTQYQIDRASLPVQREELINYAKCRRGGYTFKESTTASRMLP